MSGRIIRWPTKLVCDVKGKPCNFEACLCGSLCSTFTASSYPYAFYNERLQMLFKDQLDRSKATCTFKVLKFDESKCWLDSNSRHLRPWARDMNLTGTFSGSNYFHNYFKNKCFSRGFILLKAGVLLYIKYNFFYCNLFKRHLTLMVIAQNNCHHKTSLDYE